MKCTFLVALVPLALATAGYGFQGDRQHSGHPASRPATHAPAPPQQTSRPAPVRSAPPRQAPQPAYHPAPQPTYHPSPTPQRSGVRQGGGTPRRVLPNPPPNWQPPHRPAVHKGWDPNAFRTEARQQHSWTRHGHVYIWNPAIWVYPLTDDVTYDIYSAERTSNDMRDAFQTQVSDYNLLNYAGGAACFNRVNNLDNSLETLRAQAGSVGPDTMGSLVSDVVSKALKLQRSFDRHPYLQDLVPDYWLSLRGDIRALGAYYNVDTGAL